MVLFVPAESAFQTSPLQYRHPLPAQSGSPFGSTRNPRLPNGLQKITGIIRSAHGGGTFLRDTQHFFLLPSGSTPAIWRRAEPEPRQQFYYSREPYYHQHYGEAIQVFAHFLDKSRDWVENNIDTCCYCAYCYDMSKWDSQDRHYCTALPTTARAEACCELCRCFFQREQIPLAAYWYSLTPTCTLNDSRGGLVSPGLLRLPDLHPAVYMLRRLNDLKQGQQMNDLAARFKPDTAPVLHNRAWFQHTTAKG